MRASQDSDAERGSRTIGHTASGGGYNVTTPVVVTAREQDDGAGFVFTDSGGSAIQKFSVPEGGSAPTAGASVTVTLTSSGDDDITFSPPGPLTFTDTTPQTVTVSVAEDNDPDNGTKTITHTGDSADTNYDNNVALLSVEEADNDHDIIIRNAADTADISTIAVTEGSSATYKVKLAVKPSANVTVTIAEETGGDEDITVSPKTLIFTSSNYSTARIVTLRAAQDDGSLEGQRKILHTASGGGYNITTPVELLATEVDDDKKIYIHDGNDNDISTISVPEGGTARYVVQTGETIADNVTVTVTLTASGDQDITFDTDLDTPGDQDTITFTANISGPSSNWPPRPTSIKRPAARSSTTRPAGAGSTATTASPSRQRKSTSRRP